MKNEKRVVERIPVGNDPIHKYIPAVHIALLRSDKVELSARGINNRTAEELIRMFENTTAFPVVETKRYPIQSEDRPEIITVIYVLEKKRGGKK